MATLTGISRIDRIAYGAGAILILSGLVHLVLLLVTGATWLGPLSLRKAATFGLSFGLTLINVTLVASYLSLPNRRRTILIGGFSAACVLETFLVSMQAWRGVPSHFNMETRFDATVAQLLAVGGAVLVGIIVALTVAAFRRPPDGPPAFGSAIRAGLLALTGAQVTGAIMIATGVRLVIGGDPGLAYATGGWLKPLHAVLMHGILVLPLSAWLISRTRWSESAQARAIAAATVGYALVAVVSAIMSGALRL